ncbi:MAG: tyrosine-type recombinase/integrase [Anaerolineaceae bacterium]|nr:tyrosine-type recombinase/integrase [Anaerolineaceae bacterium]
MAYKYKRGKIWYVAYKEKDGTIKRISTGLTTAVEAKEVLAEYQLHELRNESLNRPVNENRVSLGELKTHYLEYIESTMSPRWVHNKQLILEERIIPHFGITTPIKDITLRKIEFYQRERLEPVEIEVLGETIVKHVKPRTVNIDTHHVLLPMLRKAQEWGWLTDVPKVKKLPEDEGRMRFLTKEEAATLRDTAEKTSPEIHCFVMLGLYTGIRVGEAAMLRWQDIDFERRTITIAPREGWTTKTRRGRTVNVHETLNDFLKNYREKHGQKSELVLDLSTDAIKKRFRRLVGFAGLPAKGDDKVTPHTLRHTYASHLVMNGTPLFNVANLLGHSNTETTRLYSHLTPENNQRYVDNLDF